MRHTLIIALAIFLSNFSAALATEYQVPATPGNLQKLIDSGSLTGGDRLVLAPGYHGKLVIKGLQFEEPLTITAAGGGAPNLDQLIVDASSGIRIQKISVIPVSKPAPDEALVSVDESKAIELEHLTVASAFSSQDWSAPQWRETVRNGVFLSGQDISLTDSLVFNVRHGISTVADGAKIERNIIENFAGDGIRGIGDNSSYVENTIDTCIDIDDNHDDGFQSWSLDEDGHPGKGVVRNVRVERNRISNGDHRFTCHLQGIGLFDGIYEDWVISGNTITVDHWHGITVMGARNVVVSDNFVTDFRPGKPGAPSVTIMAHKDGRQAENSSIERNVTQPWLGGTGSPFNQAHPGVTQIENRVLETTRSGTIPAK